jgi:hypothetical protein
VILAGVAATLTLGSSTGIAQATGAPGLPAKALAKSCDLRFMPIKPTVTGPSILGNAYAVCDVPPERHELTLSLQYRQGGTWKTAESTTKDAIPNPRQVYEVKTGCEPGPWRVHAHVVGTPARARFRVPGQQLGAAPAATPPTAQAPSPAA